MSLQKEVESKITSILNRVLEEGRVRKENDPTRLTDLRFSSFPFCEIRWFLGIPGASAKGAWEPFGKSFFTSVGSTVHHVIQSAFEDLAASVEEFQLIKDWRCPKCDNVHRYCVKPKECEKCGNSHLEGEEVLIEEKNLTGHVDEVLRIRVKTNGKTLWIKIILDYKTTSTSGLNSGKLPYTGNKYQIESYAGYLASRDPEIKGWVLVYLTRDNPYKFKVFSDFDLDVEAIVARIKGYRKRFRRAARIETQDEMIELIKNRPCCDKLQPEQDECKYALTCAGRKNTSKITKMAISLFPRIEKSLPIIKEDK
jgi:hypothetical protein